MNWTRFITACVISGLIALPYNIIGCAGGDPDPYDYFVSFFHKGLSDNKAFEPFYYTNYQFLYQSEEPVNTTEATSAEWAGYSEGKCSKKEAYKFITDFDTKAFEKLNEAIANGIKLPDSIKNNSLATYLLQQKDLPAIKYLSYAKRIEPNVTATWNSWEAPEKDSIRMSKLMEEGIRTWKASTNEFLRLRYAYQVVRLALYNNSPKDCIRLYDEMVAPNKTASILQDLSSGLKAGALFRTGKPQQAAYTYSKLFSKNDVKKIANYLSFDWSVKRFDKSSRQQCLQLCKNNIEKANMLGLFALGSNQSEVATLSTIYDWAPQATMNRVLLTREVQKLEEFYFTPSLSFERGRNKAYIGYSEIDSKDPAYKAWQQSCNSLIQFCRKAAKSESTNKGLYLLAGAHAATIARQDSIALTILEEAKPLPLSNLEKDQWAMTNLLLTINSMKKTDAAFEEALLPSIEWLEKKASGDVEFAKFYRRIFSDLLATKYQSSKNARYLLCTRVADQIQEKYIKESWGYYPQAISMLHNKATAVQVEELIQVNNSTTLNAFEKYMVKKAAFNKNDLYDAAGTSQLRQYKFTEALKWFSKIPNSYYNEEPYKTYLAANPFADHILDTHAPTNQDTVQYNKLQFTQRILSLEKKAAAEADREAKAKLYYELAKGYYNMSYWGNSWFLVQYSWSTGEVYYKDPSYNIQVPNKDYYEVKKAREYYLKALAQTLQKDFQARCIFMAAKCDQKVFGIPNYYDVEEGPKRSKAYRDWLINFDKRNSSFSLLQKNFNSTPFYKEAFNTCSYLRDFVQKR